MDASLRGHFLIAGPRLRDQNFFKTVVLMVEHNDEGAMGLVVNRPSSVTVANALSGHFHLPPTADVVYVGGPVEPNALFIAHGALPERSVESPVVPGLYVATNSDVFEEVVERALGGDHSEEIPFRIYCGCAGWGPQQLEGELARGDWFTQPASAEFVFHEDPYCVWEQLVNLVYETHRLLPHTCDHPEWN
jgi:putative transcriptional regulator